MTAQIIEFRTELNLPASNPLGNPDRVTVVSDFPNAEVAAEWTDMVATHLAQTRGNVTAQAVARLAQNTVNQLQVDEEQVASVHLRSVATVQRPSGRIGGVALAHLTLFAERTQTPEGNYIVLRIGAPVAHATGRADSTEVMEAALLHLLDQVEQAATTLAELFQWSSRDCIVWNLPHRSSGPALVDELNSRLVDLFYALPHEAEFAQAA